jgi:hypothetical protein
MTAVLDSVAALHELGWLAAAGLYNEDHLISIRLEPVHSVPAERYYRLYRQ